MEYGPTEYCNLRWLGHRYLRNPDEAGWQSYPHRSLRGRLSYWRADVPRTMQNSAFRVSDKGSLPNREIARRSRSFTVERFHPKQG